MQIKDLLPLIGVIIGGLITSAVTWLNNRNANKRDDQRWERERARDRETELGKREMLTFEHRHTAYVGFLAAWTSKFEETLDPRWSDHDDIETSEEWLDPVWDQRAAVQIYGTPAGVQGCERAWEALAGWVWGSYRGRPKPSREQTQEAIEAFRAVVRRDLAVPE